MICLFCISKDPLLVIGAEKLRKKYLRTFSFLDTSAFFSDGYHYNLIFCGFEAVLLHKIRNLYDTTALGNWDVHFFCIFNDQTVN